jgi:hypothetical protein
MLPRLPRRPRSEQLGRVPTTTSAPFARERIGLGDAVEADNEAGTSRPSCLLAGDRVLRHSRLSGFETEGSSTRQKGAQSGLPTSATRPF